MMEFPDRKFQKGLHLSAPAVSNNVAALIENGIVYENGCDDTSLGGKQRQLSYKGDLYYVISVELMPKKVRAGIAECTVKFSSGQKRRS